MYIPVRVQDFVPNLQSDGMEFVMSVVHEIFRLL
jgi:hypothetical protein